MTKLAKCIEPMPAPVKRAMVFICEKCSKRIDGEVKHASYKLASRLKRGVKHEFGKGEVRIVLTSCMDACPEDRIAISLQRLAPGTTPLFMEANPDDIDASCESLLRLISG